jgi:hypothetical protein
MPSGEEEEIFGGDDNLLFVIARVAAQRIRRESQVLGNVILPDAGKASLRGLHLVLQCCSLGARQLLFLETR